MEFKQCGNGISADTYETVYSFLNRFGGDICLSVEDDGVVCGIPKNAVRDIVKNFIKMVSNPDIINPTVYLMSKIIEYESKRIVHIHIPSSSEVHSCKKVLYDRGNSNGRYYTQENITGYISRSTILPYLLERIKKLIQRRLTHQAQSSRCSEVVATHTFSIV